jgi:hypothetical protein
MSLFFYKWFHLVGIGLMLLSLSGLSQTQDEQRKSLSITHGVGLLITLIGGFGLLARLGIKHGDVASNGWVLAKIEIWGLFGALIALFKRNPELSKPLW